MMVNDDSFEDSVYVVKLTSHEIFHSYFPFYIGTNESKYAWMDEGFASYIEYLSLNTIMNRNKDNPFEYIYKRYFDLARSGREQPQTTHSDRYHINGAYSVSAYYKGAIFLVQLGYVIGEENLKKTLKRYLIRFLAQKIMEVCNNLNFSGVEIRSEYDADVLPYMHDININWIQVEVPEKIKLVTGDPDSEVYAALIREILVGG